MRPVCSAQLCVCTCLCVALLSDLGGGDVDGAYDGDDVSACHVHILIVTIAVVSFDPVSALAEPHLSATAVLDKASSCWNRS